MQPGNGQTHNFGYDMEKAMEIIVGFGTEYAKLQAKVEKLEMRLATLSMVKEINEYMGNVLYTDDLVKGMKDVVAGVMGMNCRVYTQDLLQVARKQYPEFRDFDKNECYIDNLDLLNGGFLGFKSGCLGIRRLARNNSDYGYMIVHHSKPSMLDNDKKSLLELIGGMMCIYLENTELFSRVSEMAQRDGMTGYFNRFYLSQLLDDEKTKMRDVDGVMLIGIDNLKEINDSFGHLAGDSVINSLVKLINSNIDNLPITSVRYGGDEILLLCSGIEADDLSMLAEAIRIGFENTKLNEVDLSVSIGVSIDGVSSSVRSCSGLIGAAEDALHIAKTIGKNNVITSYSDLQLFRATQRNVGKSMAKYKRLLKTGSMYRVYFKADRLLEMDEFENLKTSFAAAFREYDDVFESISLVFSILSENEITTEVIEKKVRTVLVNSGLEFLGYEIASHTSTYKEVNIHSERVAAISCLLAEAYGLTADECQNVRLAAENHDIGKLFVDPRVLNKQGKLTAKEFEIVKMHTYFSYKYANNRNNLREVAGYMLYHHEYMDGTGYFKMRDVPIISQILVLADTFDALTERRCYRPAFSKAVAMDMMEKDAHRYNRRLLNLLKEVAPFV
jgi:diguanylate cyclase (GGDEF)-like protein